MNFFDKDFLQDHCQSILDFYNPRVVDPSGGFFHNFYDDGELFEPRFKHLVSSCRIVINYCRAYQVFDEPEYLQKAQHGLAYIELSHKDETKQNYAWTLRDHKSADTTQHAYGYAFLLLTFCWAKKVGIGENESIEHIFNLLEARFWQPQFGLYADEITPDGILSDYRGQNANMHLCEALICAYEATDDTQYLQRAFVLAENITVRQAGLTDGLIWEHYTKDFQPDWQYNIDDPKNLYRPWGFQGGHQIEWSKLLLQLNRHQAQPWLVKRAVELFDLAYERSWDEQHGGLIYGFDSKNQWCDDDKYFWVQAEAIAAAALLYQATDKGDYLTKYHQLWAYCWQHFVDHKYGAWFRVLSCNNQKYSNEKSSVGAKCDYHNLGACFDVLSIMT